MTVLNVIGAGRAGTAVTLALAGVGLSVGAIVSRTPASAQRLCDCLAQFGIRGEAVDRLEQLTQADITLLSASDGALADLAEELSVSPDCPQPGGIVFHLSGALSSAILAPLSSKGIHVASVHPVKSFSSLASDPQTLSGIWCGFEGDGAAVSTLSKWFQDAGAIPFAIDGERKPLYHAAAVVSCNYLYTLLEASMQLYEAAGIDRDAASRLLGPILHETIDNGLNLGPAEALTGPIARGDAATVSKHWAALASQSESLQALYAAMGHATVELSGIKGHATPTDLAMIREILSASPTQYPR
ncbi:putative short-subunit dehydrogenase-like oxidoreductase (DUF2520 family) [Roseibium hamelinense]|uniref:Putative short-subunit dehydrogenase-like oxidoreductase (DUF2520 family) n=1 Tax=Roseibium hamelinense TaxID=150831 RepID=A0A562SNN4_9HYPH|nr:Rossmann-like and DUF2520 domain-containing protein [Roseibium hamelinense]MTI44309.1 DUF2520 domain-containing protein [Roseibium hamelinense]TWI82915.1 putative short-subunit dehydrogenase-like oxidoreductase (DUF2520 family) [Roseibium hamelinense]